MAGKITIRRIGSMLPSICLLLLLLVCVGTVCLSTLGFPGAVVRYVEKLAAEKGVTLKIDALRLLPSRGLAVQASNVRIYADAAAQQPLVTVQRLSGGLNASYLLMGDVRPSFCLIENGQVLLPVSNPAGKFLTLKDLQFGARLGRGKRVQITTGSFSLQGIAVRVQGAYDIGSASSDDANNASASSFKVDIQKLLAEHQELIDQVYNQIESQHWSADQCPTVDVGLVVQEELRINVRCLVPSFNRGQFHFRDGVIDIRHNKDSITINSIRFRTVDPEATASFQGGYSLKDKRLSFRMESTSALMRMIRTMCNGPVQEYLFKFRHPDDLPPRINLSGDVCFEDDYSLKSARMRGALQQKKLMVGSTRIDDVELSFFYDNGNFSIDRLDLIFPDGSLRCTAAAKDGAGQAQLDADMPIDEILALVRELSGEEIALPEGLRPGERVRFVVAAQLSVPAFEPGQTQWQGFVPSFHVLAADIRTDSLAYAGNSIREPHIHVEIKDIRQSDTLAVLSLGKVELKIDARELLADADCPLTLAEPVISLTLSDIAFGEDSLPRSIREIVARAEMQAASVGGESPLSLTGIAADAVMQELSRTPEQGVEGVAVAHAKAGVTAERVESEHVRTGAVQLELSHVQNAALKRPLLELLDGVQLQASVNSVARGDVSIGDVALALECPSSQPGKVSLQLTPTGEDEPSYVTAVPVRRGNTYRITDVDVHIRHAALALLPELMGTQIEDIELPQIVSVKGGCSFDVQPFRLGSGRFRIEVPELVRTPHRQAALRGSRVPISVAADVVMGALEPSVLGYHAGFSVTHETGEFSGVIEGSSLGNMHITGSNTIRPDVLDMLIDDADAHSIIRDFRFPSHASVKVSNIDAHVNIANGLAVDATCDVEMLNTEYLMSAVQELPGGAERVRRDLGGNPYTLLNRASCRVRVFVREDCHLADGSPMGDESCITITDVVMDYNNAPWLRRCGWTSGARSSRLEGQSVIIDIEHSFVELNNVRGKVYPAYSLGMFYPDLQLYLKDVLLPEPVRVETPQCVFPIYSDCKRPMSGTIRVLSPGNAGFRFLGTTIPLKDFSGFVYLTDDYVQLDRMNAKCWEGVLNAVVKIGISGKTTSFDGYATAQCMNLEKIAAAYGSKQSRALCNGEIRFRSPSAELKDIRAYGQVEIRDGDLMRLSLFKPVSDLITDLPGHFMRLEKEVSPTSSGQPKQESKPGFFMRMFSGFFKGIGSVAGKTTDGVGSIASNVPGMNHLIAYDLQEAFVKFDILNGHFITRRMKAIGYNLNVDLNIDIDLDTLEMNGNLWPRISSLPTVILAPLTFLSDFMVDIIIYGKVNDIKWRIGLDKRASGQKPSATSEPASGTQPRKRTTR